MIDYNFNQICGPKGSDTANFEELVSQLLAAELDAEAINGEGGDKGVDCFIGRLRGELTVFQTKYFNRYLGKSQRRQIRNSFATASATHCVQRWVLCTPRNPSHGLREWLDSLDPQIECEWWGESKLRSLLSKHPRIGQSFFRNEYIAARFESLEDEVYRLRRSLLPPDPSTLSTWSQASVIDYLREVYTTCLVVLDDTESISATNRRWICIDFSELYVFVKTDLELAVKRPLVDFCVRKSPYPIILPPGTVYEVANHFRRSPFRQDPVEFLAELRNAPESTTFLHEFERNPSSRESMIAYRQFLARMEALEVLPNTKTNLLTRILLSGLLAPAPDIEKSFPRAHLNKALQYFDVRRPQQAKAAANVADAANFAFLCWAYSESGEPSRILSSARTMNSACELLAKKKCLVRKPRDYAAFIMLLRHPVSKIRMEMDDALRASKKLLSFVRAPHSERVDSTTEGRLLRDSLAKFAPHFRNLFRPIDEMIEEQLHAIPRDLTNSLPGYYELLKEHSSRVMAFKQFWEKASRDADSVVEILRSRYGYDQIASQLERNA